MFQNHKGWTVTAAQEAAADPAASRPHNDRRSVSPYLDHVSHAQPGIQPLNDRLYVIAVISNPMRFRKRYRHYEAFQHQVEAAGATLLTVECAFGEREFEITSATNPWNLQLRQFDSLWNKESTLNAGVQHLTKLVPGWKYFAWIDADVTFQRNDWAQEALHQMQHNKVVQLFSSCMDLTDDFEPLVDAGGNFSQPGFIAQWYKTFRYGSHAGMDLGYSRKPGTTVPTVESFITESESYYSGAQLKTITGTKEIPGEERLRPGHCGYAWAMRRDAYEELGGLLDVSICGANDHHMAAAFIGDILCSVNHQCHPAFLEELTTWGERAEAHIKPYVGFVPGLVTHHFHGSKAGRRYIDRWKILVDNQYNPRKHIRRDAQGLWVWNHPHTPRNLVVDLRGYFAQRSEDESYRPIE